MIKSFGNRFARELYDDKVSRAVRTFPQELRRAPRRKILYLHDAAETTGLRVPFGNRLEALHGDLQGYHSIRTNQQWRVVFRWKSGDAYDVQVLDYH